MRTSAFISFLLCIVACASTPPVDPADRELATTLSQLTEERAAAGQFSGVVLVARGDRPILHRAYGLADREAARANDTSTRFNLASLGKMFTAVAAAQLVEEGSLDFDAPVGRSIQLGNPAIERKVTLHHLLTHTSGIPDLPDDLFNAPPATLEGYRDFFAQAELQFEPGSRRSYSNSGFVLVGMLIEKASGQRYDEFVSERLFARAGMSSAGFEPDEDRRATAAQGYLPAEPDGTWERATNRHAGGPHGGSFATAMDLVRFFEALRSGQLVRRETAERITTPRAGSSAYGFGVLDLGADRLVGHSGGDAGASADAYHYWTSGYTIVVLSNLSPPASHAVAGSARELLQPRLTAATVK